MKRIYLVLALVISASFAYGQCVPDLSYTSAGIFPPTGSIQVGNKVQLPTAEVGMAYDQVIQIVIPVDTMIDTLGSSFPGIVDSMEVTSVAGLPASISYSCNTSNCLWEGGDNGCISLTGTPTASDVGVHPLSVEVTGYVLFFGVPLSGQSTITDFQILVDQAGSITEIGKNEVVAYPNPSQGNMNWRYPSASSGEVELRIYNLVGSELARRSYTVVSGENTLEWDLSELPTGMYIYEIDGQIGQFMIDAN